MAQSFFSTVILIGAIQGFIMSWLLFSMQENRLPARALAWLLILISVASLNIWSWSVQSWQNTFVYAFITQCLPLIVIMPVGPLIWLYVRSVLDPGLKMNRKERMHFLPVIIDLVPALVNCFYLMLLLANTGKEYLPFLNRFVDDYNVYSDLPRWLSVTWYSYKSIQYLKKADINSAQGNSAQVNSAQSNSAQGSPAQCNAAQGSSANVIGSIDSRSIPGPAIEQQSEHVKWLRQFLYVFMIFCAIWLCQLVPYLIPKYTDWVLDKFGWYPVYVPLSLLIYVLGTKGYLQVKQLRQIQKKESPASSYTEEQVAETISVLQKAMDHDKLYLDASLNLSAVSAHTGLPQKQISAVLNQHINASFNEYVNRHRVEEVIARLSQQESNKLTLAGLGYECGFNSQPTFQRAFKSVTGKTPSQYQASRRKTPQD